MKRFSLLSLIALLVASLSPGAVPAQRKPPRRPEKPFRVHVASQPESEERYPEALPEAQVELEKRLRKNKRWFLVTKEAEDADIRMTLRGYWTREEKRVQSVWGVISPVEEQRQPDKTQIVEIVSHHSLRARVDLLGQEITMTGVKIKKHRGGPRDAARDLASRLERYCKENYWTLSERR